MSLEGAGLALDRRDTAALYGQVLSPAEVLGGAAVPVPRAATPKGWLDDYTREQARR